MRNNLLIPKVANIFRKRFANVRESRKWSIETFPVRVIITGIEHSGTTILSTLIKQEPRLNSGFECGFLLADSPQDFKNVHPWYEWMHEPVARGQWGVSPEDMERICLSATWQEVYEKLIRFSPVFDQNKQQQVCDKTPRYLKYLDKVLDKLPECIPCFVIEKNIRNLWFSHKKRYGNIVDFVKYSEQYYEGLRRGLARHGHRIHRIQYESLCLDLETELKRIFSVLNLVCEPEYVSSHAENLEAYYGRISEDAASLPSGEEELLQRLQKRYSDILITPYGVV